jgi:hypothetical protein
MADSGNPASAREFSEKNLASCRIETGGGTVYWLSTAGPDGIRWVVREHLRCSETNTMVMQKFSDSQERLDLGDKFRASLSGDVVVGLPFVLEVKNRGTRILTEAVVAIEVGDVPAMIFGS